MHLPAPRRRSGRRGFTLIELLTVIAIIAVLAGLLFPVFASVRENARQGSCMSNIKSIIQGIKMYKDDHRVCPDALYAGFNTVSGQLEERLYPNYVKEKATFVCPNSPIKLSDTPQTAMALNLGTGNTHAFADFSSYDYQIRNPQAASPTREVHYALKWTPATLSGLSDQRRQLYFREPPDNTMVTYCLYHAGMDRTTGAVKKGHMALVGFWDGRVQKIDAEKFVNWPAGQIGMWPPFAVTPKP